MNTTKLSSFIAENKYALITAAVSITTLLFIRQVKKGQDAKSKPQEFAALYWKKGQPSQALQAILKLLLPDLPSNSSLEAVVKATQLAWFRKNRWEVQEDDAVLKALAPKVRPLLTQLGFDCSFTPRGRYDVAILLGGRANHFMARCYSLTQAIKEKSISVSRIDILVGSQKLHATELEILAKSAYHISGITTEEDLARVLAEKMLKSQNIEYNIVVTNLGDKKPSTEQTVEQWIQSGNRTNKKLLIVSDPQFAVYQYFQCREALFKHQLGNQTCDLLSRQLDERDLQMLNLQKEQVPISLHLDTLTRTLYTLQHQISKNYFA